MEENKEDFSRGQKATFTRKLNEFKAKAKGDIEELRKEKDSVLDELMGARKEIIGEDDSEESLLSEARETVAEMKELKAELEQLKTRIYTADPRTRKTLAQTITAYADEFDKEHSSIRESIEAIREFEEEMLGGEDVKGKPIEGVKQRMLKQEKAFDQLHEQHDEEQQNLFDKIESLLQGASTVALAKSFKEHKESFNTVNRWWTFAFIVCIGIMMTASAFAFFQADYNPAEMWKYTLGLLPVLGGAIWMAIYASKQRSQNKRLQQEYAFKEDVAKIYYGLKTEIEELGNPDLGEKLKERILAVIVEVVSLNPSETLDSHSHNDKGPVIEMLKEINGAIKNTKGLGS